MAANKNEYNIGSVNATNSAFALGDNNTISNEVNIRIQHAASELISEINKNIDMPHDMKQEMSEAVGKLSEQGNVEKMNSTLKRSLFSRIEKIYSLITKSAALIVAYEKWSELIKPILDNLPF